MTKSLFKSDAFFGGAFLLLIIYFFKPFEMLLNYGVLSLSAVLAWFALLNNYDGGNKKEVQDQRIMATLTIIVFYAMILVFF